MTIKKYEAIGQTQLSTFVIINGQRIDIDFTPGYPYSNKYASYTCKDKAIQDALESTMMYKSGRLVLTSVIEKIEPPKEVVILKKEEVATSEEGADNQLSFDSLKTLQTYLMKSHKVSYTDIRSKENALAKAESLGLDVRFNA